MRQRRTSIEIAPSGISTNGLVQEDKGEGEENAVICWASRFGYYLEENVTGVESVFLHVVGDVLYAMGMG